MDQTNQDAGSTGGRADGPDDGPEHPPPADALVIDALGDHAPALDPLIRTLAATLTKAGARGEARVRIVNDAEMTRLHREHKGQDSTTDVLTFDLSEEQAAALDVDITICTDEAERQATARGIPVEHELLLYIVHGLMHCLGENDDTRANADRMHAREDELLTAIGIGPVYNTEQPTSGSAP